MMTKSIAKPVLTQLARRVLAIARYTLLEAWRNRFGVLLTALVVAAVLASVFVRQQAITESGRAQLVTLASMLRLGSVFIVTAIVLQISVREFHDKVLELMLSLDLPRSGYLAGKFLGYASLCAVCAAVVSLPLLFLADARSVLLWATTHLLELWIVSAFALFCVTTFSQFLAAAALVLAFYLLARMITAIQLVSRSTLAEPGPAGEFASWLADAIALLLPRLDAFAQTAWLIDAPAHTLSLPGAMVQTGIYVGLLLAAAMFDLYRRNF